MNRALIAHLALLEGLTVGSVLEALLTGAGMLWKAVWALIFGYVISAASRFLLRANRWGP